MIYSYLIEVRKPGDEFYMPKETINVIAGNLPQHAAEQAAKDWGHDHYPNMEVRPYLSHRFGNTIADTIDITKD